MLKHGSALELTMPGIYSDSHANGREPGGTGKAFILHHSPTSSTGTRCTPPEYHKVIAGASNPAHISDAIQAQEESGLGVDGVAGQ